MEKKEATQKVLPQVPDSAPVAKRFIDLHPFVPLIAFPAEYRNRIALKGGAILEATRKFHYRPAEPFFTPLLKPRDKGNWEAIAGSLRFRGKGKSNPPRRNLRGDINSQAAAGG